MDPHFINRSTFRWISRGPGLAAFILVALVTSILAAAVKAEPSDKGDKPVAGDKTESKTEVAAKPGITVEAATQEHLGLKVETPVAASWQPGLRATGRVANPLTFLAAVTEYQPPARKWMSHKWSWPARKNCATGERLAPSIGSRPGGRHAQCPGPPGGADGNRPLTGERILPRGRIWCHWRRHCNAVNFRSLNYPRRWGCFPARRRPRPQ